MSFDDVEEETTSVIPSAVTLHRAKRTLELAWGCISVAVPHQTLRLACRCAECESRRRGGNPMRVSQEVELLRIEPVGEVGLQFFFSDSHQRGIYPWGYLQEIALR